METDLLKQQLKIINQFFEIGRKLNSIPGSDSLQRNMERIRNYYEEMGLQIHDPLNEAYSETRTDCEASISGTSVENLYIHEVIKPIVRHAQENGSLIVQKAIVIVKAR